TDSPRTVTQEPKNPRTQEPENPRTAKPKTKRTTEREPRTPNPEPAVLPSKVRVGPVDPVLTDRTEDVEDDRVLDHFDLVRDVWWNLHHLARADDEVASVDLEAQRTIDDDADLLVLVRVQRHHSAALQFEACHGDALSGDVLT